MRVRPPVLIMAWLISATTQAADDAVHHTVVYQRAGEFVDRPANDGIWNWGDEIIVGLVAGSDKKPPTRGQDIDRDRPSIPRQVRSLDDGETGKSVSVYFYDNSEVPQRTIACTIRDPEQME